MVVVVVKNEWIPAVLIKGLDELLASIGGAGVESAFPVRGPSWLVVKRSKFGWKGQELWT